MNKKISTKEYKRNFIIGLICLVIVGILLTSSFIKQVQENKQEENKTCIPHHVIFGQAQTAGQANFMLYTAWLNAKEGCN